MARGRGSCDVHPAGHRPAEVQLSWLSRAVRCAVFLGVGSVFPRVSVPV